MIERVLDSIGIFPSFQNALFFLLDMISLNGIYTKKSIKTRFFSLNIVLQIPNTAPTNVYIKKGKASNNKPALSRNQLPSAFRLVKDYL